MSVQLTKIDLECPPDMKPKQYAVTWVKSNYNGEPILVKVNNKQNIARNHTNVIDRSYFFLFINGKHVLGHIPGMDRLFTENTFEYMIFYAQVKKLRPKRLKRILEVQEQLNGGEMI